MSSAAKALLPLICGAGVIIASATLFKLVGFGTPARMVARPQPAMAPAARVEQTEKDPATTQPAAGPGKALADYAADLSARLGWAVAALVLLASLAATFVFACVTLVHWARGHNRGWRVLVGGLVVLGVLTTAAAFAFGKPPTFTLFVEESIELVGTRVPFDAAGAMFVAGLATVLLVLAALCTLSDPRPLAPGAAANVLSPGELRQRASGLRAMFYASSILLIAAVAEVYALYQWPATRPAVANADAVRQVAASMSASFGGVCTVLLLACFVPAATAVRRLSYDSAAGATDAERKAWLEAEGITVSWQEWFGRIATALGPLIAGTSLPAIAEVVK